MTGNSIVKCSSAIRVRARVIAFALARGRSGRVARLGLGGCGCVALLLFARPALATSVPPAGQLVWETPKGFVLTNPLGHGATVLPALPAIECSAEKEGRAFTVGKQADERERLGAQWSARRNGSLPVEREHGPYTSICAVSLPSGAGADYASGLVAFSPDSRAIAYGYLPGLRAAAARGGRIHECRDRAQDQVDRHPEGSTKPGVFQWLPNGRFLFVGASGLRTCPRPEPGRDRSISTFRQRTRRYKRLRCRLTVRSWRWRWTRGRDVLKTPLRATAPYMLRPPLVGQRYGLHAPRPRPSPCGRLMASLLVYDKGGTTKLITVATRHAITVRSPRVRAWIVGWRPAP